MSQPDETPAVRDVFANPTNTSPDFSARVYRYRDANFGVIHQTSVPKDDEAALAYFHTVYRFGPDYKPVYVERRTSSAEETEVFEALDYMFDLKTMSVVDW